VLVNLCTIVPDGVVVFFPSYAYESQVFARWSESGLLARLEAKKRVFREPTGSSKADSVFRTYSDEIHHNFPENGKVVFVELR